MYILLAILVFGILIAVHELGHFLVAKACGVRVDEFAIGMGPAIWKKQKGETLYAVRCLPIGGYCAMAGEDEAIDDPCARLRASRLGNRFLILCAGAFMNFVFGLLLLLIVFAQAKELFHADAHGLHGRLPLSGGGRPAGGRHDLEYRRASHLFHDQCQ